MEQRELTFSDGSSNKFWNITLNGKEHTVQYGRIGTSGQSQTKTFASDAEAKSSYDKLVAEKVKKGYADAASPGTAPVAPAAAQKPAQPNKPKAAVNDSAGEDETPAPPRAQQDILEEPRRILLDAEDLRWAPWKPQAPRKVRPAALPFDIDDAVARLQRVGKDGYSYNWRWSWARIPISMSREEAHFWIAAMTGLGLKIEYRSYQTTPERIGEALRKAPLNGDITITAALDAFNAQYYYNCPEAVLPLFNLFGAKALLLQMDPDGRPFRLLNSLRSGFIDYVFPYLADDELAELRETLVAVFESVRPGTEPPEWALEFAALVGGLANYIEPVVMNWQPMVLSRWGGDHRLHIALGLADPEKIATQVQRIGLFPFSSSAVRALLACTDYAALDFIKQSIVTADQKQEAETLAKAFGRVEAPEAAPHMLEIMTSSKAPRVAREWLEAHPAHAVDGILPLVTEGGKTGQSALEFVADMKRRGQTAVIRSRLPNLPEDAASKIQTIMDTEEKEYATLEPSQTPDWLRDALTKAPQASAAEIARGVSLPPVLVPPADGGELRRLTDAQTGALLAALRKSTFESRDPLVQAIRDHADTRSRDAFALRLFDMWLGDGGPSKARWEMMAVGHLGGDTAAMKLAPLVRTWPGEAQHQRSVLGLECLRAIGTDTALMQINGIAQKVAFKGIKAKAAECMEAIAGDRGMSRAELEDRIVPDCDLDERGTRIFDFGSRKFTFVLGPDMKPMIRDEANQRRPDLPKPNSKDDEAKAEAAVAEWKLLKKQIADTAKIQAIRLEQSMVTGRRWSPTDFETLLVRHPMMTNLVRLVIWGAFDAAGALLGTFRVTEDLSLADETDDTYALPANAVGIGVVHPLELSETQRGAWGEVLSDYEIVPPFEQMGRPIYRLEAGEGDSTDLAPRFKGIKIPPQSLVFTLEKQGWSRGTPMDGGVFTEHFKVFHNSKVTAYICYDGVPVGYMEGWDDQQIERVIFISGTKGESGYISHYAKNPLKVGSVDPIVLSEVLKDATLIASKGKSQ